MKKLNSLLLLMMIGISNLFCQPTNFQKENGLLWEISGNGLQQSSYLFGTFHGVGITLCHDILDSIPGFYRSFNSSTQYVCEVTGQSIKDAFKILGEPLMPKGITYKNLLNETEIQYLDSILLVYMGYKSNIVVTAPNYVNFVLLQKIATKIFQPDSSLLCTEVMDAYLLKKAIEKKYEVKGLDTPNVLQQVIKRDLWGQDSIPKSLEESAVSLVHRLKRNFNEYEKINLSNVMKVIKKVEEAYKNQDLWSIEIYKNELTETLKPMMEEEMKDSVNFDTYYDDFLLKDRNQIWMQQIPDLIDNQSTFIGVGAAHLYGEIGLINLLREKGYIVKPVQ